MKVLLTAIVVFFCASAAFAERRVALIFGADRYETIRPLANAVNDARAIEEALEALEFEVFSETNRDLRRMRRALEDFEEDATGADVAFVFFAGHGVEIGGENRLLPTDADASNLEALKASSLALNDLQAVVARVAASALIVLDACRDDPFATQSDPSGRGAFSLALPETVKPGLGRVGSVDNTLIAFSAAPGETASDGNDGNSPFTSALAKYLDMDGLEIRSVLTLVQQEVYDRTRGAQLPYVESGLPSLFFANQTSDTLPERERLLLAMADIDDTTRQDVERVAQDTGAPLAPLYGTLIGSELAQLDRQQRRVKLREAATAFTRVRDELRLLRSGDARVTGLRQQAEEQLSLGAFDAARARLTEAASIDANSRETLKANLNERTLSEAASHYLNGGAAQAELRYALALSDHAQAVALFDEVDDDAIPPAARRQQLNALAAMGRVNITIGSLFEASEAFAKQLAVAQIAVSLDPKNTEAQYDLALAQDNLGDVLFEQGKIADALVHFRDGHAVRLGLAEQKPEDEQVKFALSNSYQRLGQIYQRQGDLAAAQAIYLDKYRLATAMATAVTSGYRWDRDVALSEERLGDILKEQGDLPGALAHYSSGLDRMVPIRDANPDDLELRRFTSITLDRMGDVFAAQGKLQPAKEKYEESRRLREALVTADPANVDWQYVLGISHEHIGDVLSRLGDQDAATQAYEEKHKIASLLATGDPTNVRWLRDLSVADERLGSLARRRGEPDKAIRYFESSLDRMTAVSAASPTDMELKRFLSFTQNLIAHTLMDQDKTEAALGFYESSRLIREKLVARDPENPDWRFILGVSHELVGNVYMQTDRPARAVTAYAQELETMSVLLEQNPENTRWHRAVSITNELLGDALLATGEVEAALDQYATSLGRMSVVRDADPTNLSFQRFTAITLRKIGQTQLDVGDRSNALASYTESQRIARLLVTANPENGWWLRDLLFAQKGVVEAGGDAKATVAAAQETTRAMADLGVLQASDEAILEELLERLKASGE